MTVANAEVSRKSGSVEKQQSIEIFGAREHNLKEVNLTIPRNQMVRFPGLVGVGNLL